MSRNIQQGSDSDSSPTYDQSHNETSQVSPENQQKRQLKSVRFVKDDPESSQDPDPQIRPASANNADSVPHPEFSNCTTGSMTVGNGQEDEDPDAEPDACVPGTHGCDSVPSVSEDYVPWLEMDEKYWLEGAIYPDGIIPEISKIVLLLPVTSFFLAILITGIRMVTSSRPSEVSFEPFRWPILMLYGGFLNMSLFSLFGLGLAFHYDAPRLKAFRNSFWGLIPHSISYISSVSILVGIYYASSTHLLLAVGWYTGPLPQSSRGCEARVGPAQSSLFTEHIYASQFARIQVANLGLSPLSFLKFDVQAFDAIRHNQILCNQGFIGNSDLYGLGSRVSLYLQWITALVINNFVPRNRNEFRKVYLAYSLGLCIATFVFTFSTACTFAVEIEILYWAYWGGYLCIFATSPSYRRLGSEVKWIGLDWITGINYFLHILMFYHSTFFWHYGYDQVFSRMPCGTYHFFFTPLLDPSKSFWFFRDALTIIINPVNIALIVTVPIVSLCLMSEIKESICDSSVCQNLGIYLRGSGGSDSGTGLAIDAAQASLSSRFQKSLRALGFFCVKRYRELREWYLLPPYSRKGIRLLTPIDIKQRKYVHSTDE